MPSCDTIAFVMTVGLIVTAYLLRKAGQTAAAHPRATMALIRIVRKFLGY